MQTAPIRFFRTIITAAFVCFLAGQVAAEPIRWFPIATNPSFADVTSQLQLLVDTNGHQSENRICVVGEEAETTMQAYVYWPTENKLILWVPDRNNDQGILDSRRYLDLKRDVARNGGIGTSTYLMSRATADSKIAACKKYGTIVVVKRRVVASTRG